MRTRTSPRRPPGFRVFRGPDGVAGAFGPNVVAFGKFDGLHLGHRALLDRAAGAARRLGLPHGAVTFARHPAAFLGHGPAPPALTGIGEKLRLFRDAGVDFVVLLPADASVLSVAADRFARDVLHVVMAVRVVVVGENFRFGHRGSGGVLTLRELSSVGGPDGVEVGMVEVAGGPVSATRIRTSLAHGDVVLARNLLGRSYEVAGLLRVLDPATATVTVPAVRAVPAPGEYAGSLRAGMLPTCAATAVVEVGHREDGRHLLTVRCGRAAFPGGRPAGRATVRFDRRLEAG